MMGMFDTINVPCPSCGRFHEAQSKGGRCSGLNYDLIDAPADVLGDVNRHAPFLCEKCGTIFRVRLIGITTIEGRHDEARESAQEIKDG